MDIHEMQKREVMERIAVSLERIAAVLESCRGATFDGEGFWKVVVGDNGDPVKQTVPQDFPEHIARATGQIIGVPGGMR